LLEHLHSFGIKRTRIRNLCPSFPSRDTSLLCSTFSKYASRSAGVVVWSNAVNNRLIIYCRVNLISGWFLLLSGGTKVYIHPSYKAGELDQRDAQGISILSVRHCAGDGPCQPDPTTTQLFLRDPRLLWLPKSIISVSWRIRMHGRDHVCWTCWWRLYSFLWCPRLVIIRSLRTISNMGNGRRRQSRIVAPCDPIACAKQHLLLVHSIGLR
jgi:hypothetical protein